MDFHTQVEWLCNNEHIALKCINLAQGLINQNWDFEISLKYVNFSLIFSSKLVSPLQANQTENIQVIKKKKKRKQSMQI